MEIILIEDELPARERLRQMIQEYDPDAVISASAGSVREAVRWLETHPEPDLMIVDIQLSDGLSFEIFTRRPVRCPLIFATAFDEYILPALRHNGIDYLLKPVKREELFRALDKYRHLKQHFTGDMLALIQELRTGRPGYRSRLTVRKGTGYLSMAVEEIAFFFSEHKLVFLVDQRGEKYLLDGSLQELESRLDPAFFFRLNRKYLAHIGAIHRFYPGEKGKLIVELQPAVLEEVFISQEKAGLFRDWLER